MHLSALSFVGATIVRDRANVCTDAHCWNRDDINSARGTGDLSDAGQPTSRLNRPRAPSQSEELYEGADAGGPLRFRSVWLVEK